MESEVQDTYEVSSKTAEEIGTFSRIYISDGVMIIRPHSILKRDRSPDFTFFSMVRGDRLIIDLSEIYVKKVPLYSADVILYDV